MKVLKVMKYRGARMYIRSLRDRWYEVLVVFRGQLYCHQLQVLKEMHKEKRASLETREEGAIGELMDCGQTMVDNFLEELSWSKVVKNKIQNLITKIYGKIKRGEEREATGI